MSVPTPDHRRQRTTVPRGNKFSGQIEWVQLDIGEDSHDDLIKTEDLFTIAMSRQ